jgi:hypothetical protein
VYGRKTSDFELRNLENLSCRPITHRFAYSMHSGSNKMYLDLRDLYWWLGMKREVAQCVSEYLVCLRIKAEHKKTSRTFRTTRIDGMEMRTYHNGLHHYATANDFRQ